MRLLFALFIFSCSLYLYVDRQLFFYGTSDFSIYKTFPVKIMPEHWDYDAGNLGLVLADEYGFAVVRKGINRYRSSEILVNEIVKYGFDEHKVVVQVTDSIGGQNFIVIEPGDNVDIDASVQPAIDVSDVNWINVKDEDLTGLTWSRSFLRITIFVLALVQIGFIIRGRFLVAPKNR